MFNSFLSVLLREMLHTLVKHKDFFKKDEKARLKTLESLRIPANFKHYLAEVSEKDLMMDLRLIVQFIDGRVEELSQAAVQKSAFFKAFIAFLTGPFAGKFDKLGADFYTFSETDQRTVVDALIKSDTALAKSLKHLLLQHSYQELAAGIQALATRVLGAPYVLVQSPRDVDPELKKEIRKELNEQLPGSFPVFQINKKLIGGLRIFKNGETLDYSWLSRVLRVTNI